MKRVLVVGASGNLGSKIVSALAEQGGASIRVTHRASSKPEKLSKLRALGAEMVVADLADPSSLDAACKGVDVVVSAVQGLADVIVEGQTHLLRAAEKNGVARMLPSDYALDFFKTKEGGNRNLDLRRDFDRVLDASKVRGSSVLCGAFMDLLAWGAMGPDPKTGVFRVFGDEDQPYDFTHTDDVAKYVAAVALDDGAGRHVRVAGDTQSPRQLAQTFAEVRGSKVTIENAGSLEDLDRMIAGMRAKDPAPEDTFPVWQRMQYARDMASGLGKLEPLDNARYPSIRPKTIRELLSSPR
jgi:nucleoside-diphosphate-sugar epimerase